MDFNATVVIYRKYCHSCGKQFNDDAAAVALPAPYNMLLHYTCAVGFQYDGIYRHARPLAHYIQEAAHPPVIRGAWPKIDQMG